MNDEVAGYGALADISVEIAGELGRCSMRLRDIVGLGPGSLVTLNRRAGAAIDVRVNGRLIAYGDIVAIDDRYGVRITDVLSGPDREVAKNA